MRSNNAIFSVNWYRITPITFLLTIYYEWTSWKYLPICKMKRVMSEAKLSKCGAEGYRWFFMLILSYYVIRCYHQTHPLYDELNCFEFLAFLTFFGFENRLNIDMKFLVTHLYAPMFLFSILRDFRTTLWIYSPKIKSQRCILIFDRR